MKRHADCACNPVHCDDTDTTSLWPADGTLTDQQAVVARLLGMTVRGGRVRCSVAAWGTVQAVVGLIEGARSEATNRDDTEDYRHAC
jgi:hypothetical protein